MSRVEIRVEGMHCDGCEQTLSNSLMRLEGVIDAKANRGEGRVRVSIDPARVSEDVLRERITACGYRPVEPAGRG